MPADASPVSAWAPIDVYADVVPGLRQRSGGQRRVPAPVPTGALEHGYRQPELTRAPIGRPTVWSQTAADRDTVLARFDTLVTGVTGGEVGKRERRRRHGVVLLLDWLASFDGDTWQQRWVASGLNDHGNGWTGRLADPATGPTGHRRATLIGGAGALL